MTLVKVAKQLIAGSIADYLEGVVIPLMVHTYHNCGGISRRGRDDDPFGSSLQLGPILLHGGEEISICYKLLSTSSTTFDVGGILLLEDVKFPILSLACAIELAMCRVILEHVDHVVKVNEGVTDGKNIHFARHKGSLGNQKPSTAISVHSDLHHPVSGARLALHNYMRLSRK